MSGGSSSGWRAAAPAAPLGAQPVDAVEQVPRLVDRVHRAAVAQARVLLLGVARRGPAPRPSSRPSRGRRARPRGCSARCTIAKSAATPWRAQARPPTPLDSSSVFVHTIRSPASPPAAATASAATTIAAIPPFMSHAPRPTTRPSRDLRVERVLLPAVLAPRGHDVDVAVEQQRRAAARAARSAPPAAGGPRSRSRPRGRADGPRRRSRAGSHTSTLGAGGLAAAPARKLLQRRLVAGGLGGIRRGSWCRTGSGRRAAPRARPSGRRCESTSRCSSGVRVSLTARQSKRGITRAG